nr:IS110 family transposase [Streptomyces globosus]
MPNSEPKLRAVFEELKAKFATALAIVVARLDRRPAPDRRPRRRLRGRLPARARHATDRLPLPGEAKAGAKDAAVIADAVRTTPHSLRPLELTDEITAELTALKGFGQDLAAEATRTSDRIRGLLIRFHA